ncbi:MULTISPECIES: hypothetical protein [unclassified Streptomyces]|uniref:hypothetical protein n=1 Tax=unclassified Streptomyces TaxID=2593676 RepID=UPI00088C02D8|nr:MULTISPECIES: hypothetical protein [unclassified Streptomyces]PBC86651.1 hypothetical protein BX261_6754 [Streptomyces sp. 2321.6]SDQ76999.1 hypothetical protein SAMN05216511_0497 [Streptomyces sp. KS_16]SEE05165.1 hypothetical protein SAMN05428940_6780 [Streptomyces sp. 2133.1]SNC73790.1 hypothetical protein SAMN06272741_6683 [Streptomyces sp. 2114.4]
MHMRQESVRPATTARRRSAAVGAALAAVSALGLATAAPASAEVKSTCGTYICVATAYQGRDYVQDITVTTRDGLPGTLRAFVGDYGNRKANVSRWRFVVNREIRAYPRLAVCGGLDRSGRVIENHCVLIP